MKLIEDPLTLSRLLKKARARGQKIALVPTMGALHEGHLSLVNKARSLADILVVSIFVNPAQFGPKEDLKKYPRNLRKDLAALKPFGPLFVFNPRPQDLYKKDHETWVEVEKLSQPLCGKSRPGHFRGVATVVAKLFNIVQPDLAVFGEKDYQQLQIIKKMARDLNFPIEVISCPTVREYDGLALSSRNSYLNKDERRSATILYRTLNQAKELIKKRKDAKKLQGELLDFIHLQEPKAKVEYLELLDPLTLEPKKDLKGKVLAALAVWIGKTRLIDNLTISK